MFFIVLLSQFITIASISTCIIYKQCLFSTLFNLVSAIVLLAFIPNLITSLSFANKYITFIESQILFSITGFIALVFLWVVLKDKSC